MIAGVRGHLEAAGPDWVIVAVGGVSLKLFAPSSTIEGLGAIGGRVHLYTHLQVKEDDLSLYGFSSDEARSMFETLLSISRVGPRLALSLLSTFAPESLASAIASSDVDSLSRVPGLGRKTASRIVLELRGKLEEWVAPLGIPAGDEAAAALMALGYSPAEVREAMSSLPKDGDPSLEERVRLALQRLAGE